ncbi:MAG: hypothetical protein LC790_11470, partial [Actinobacteria bacterium]|nr:hypothetical protein [Actinomycetota bacterium]
MLDLNHGGHVLAEDAPGAKDSAKKQGHRLVKKAPETTTPFDYLLPALKNKPQAHIPGDPAKVTADLKALGVALVDSAPGAAPAGGARVNSTIPTVYTYWGQFIDHDMTANTDRDSSTSDITKTPLVPVPPDKVAKDLRNLRRPTFDLDHVYGNGPGLDPNEHKPDPGPADTGFYDGIRLRVGANEAGAQIQGVKIPPEDDLTRDLPRIGPLLKAGVITEKDIPASLQGTANRDTRAFIGDLRNDENLIIAQFHLAFLRFHNRVVDAIEAKPKDFGVPPGAKDDKLFKAARRLVCHHYQWLVVNDYLKTVCLPAVVDDVLNNGPKFYKPLAGNKLFAPLEYSVAAYRFGHTMVRAAYDHNRNFGRGVPPQTPLIPVASFELLFLFTGDGHQINPSDPSKSTPNPFFGEKTLPFNWPVEWDRMTRKDDPNEAHFARKIDTRLVPPIHNMVNEGTAEEIQDAANTPLRQMLRSLAQRNLLRGYLLSIPTGQAVADAMGVAK